jgi:hypothetical protein
MTAYLDMLQNFVPSLVRNSEAVEAAEAAKDHKGLRASVIRFLKVDESKTDAELVAGLAREKEKQNVDLE